MTGWTQHSLVFNSCVIHPASCLRGGGECLRLGWTFKSFCFKKMDLLFQFPLLPCSPFSKSNKCYEKSCWTIENQKETFRWALPPPPKYKFGREKAIKQGIVWGGKLAQNSVFWTLRGSCIYELSVVGKACTYFQRKWNCCTLYDLEMNNIYIAVMLQILVH